MNINRANHSNVISNRGVVCGMIIRNAYIVWDVIKESAIQTILMILKLSFD